MEILFISVSMSDQIQNKKFPGNGLSGDFIKMCGILPDYSDKTGK
jgi:hypothetical protein